MQFTGCLPTIFIFYSVDMKLSKRGRYYKLKASI